MHSSGSFLAWLQKSLCVRVCEVCCDAFELKRWGRTVRQQLNQFNFNWSNFFFTGRPKQEITRVTWLRPWNMHTHSIHRDNSIFFLFWFIRATSRISFYVWSHIRLPANVKYIFIICIGFEAYTVLFFVRIPDRGKIIIKNHKVNSGRTFFFFL